LLQLGFPDRHHYGDEALRDLSFFGGHWKATFSLALLFTFLGFRLSVF